VPGVEQRGRLWAVLAPPVLWLVGLLVVPLLLLCAFSFRSGIGGSLFRDWVVTLENYRTLAATPSFLELLGVSVGIALVVALAATLLAYPVAYYLVFRVRARASLYVALLLVPFWISYLLRVMAWKVILGSGGAVNAFLLWLGVIQEPISVFFYSRFAVVLTLIYVWTPFVALPIMATLYRIDRSLFEAAAGLGATPAQRFWRVTVPLSMPGVLAGAVMVFIPTVGEYVTPLLVGGSTGAMYGNLIQDFFGRSANWPLGAALAVVMLLGTLVLVGATSRISRVERFIQ
jgi:spermidine/putrescine transport system permease protein